MNTIHVTRAHIDDGGTGCCNCPIWHALMPFVRAGTLVAVHATHTVFYDGSFDSRPSTVTLPDVVRTFILRNDRRRFVGDDSVPLEPIAFEIEMPDWAKLETI